MPNGVTFTHDSAVRIANAVRRIEKLPRNMTGDRNPALTPATQFWAYLTSPGGMNGLFWSWVKVVPVEDAPTAGDPVTIEDVPLWRFSEPQVAGYQNAREASNVRNVPPETVVLLSFTGYDREGEPLYVFQYAAPVQQTNIGIHDHRDNVTGQGFAFSVYHPGTGLPQQPFVI